MTNYSHGHDAEKVAARWLQSQGYKIYAVNWCHRRAEIDIVAGEANGGAPIFVEVKYRESDRQGTGLEHITPRMLKQMQFAAELWMAEHRYAGSYRLGAIELAGVDYEITNFIESLT